MGLDFLRRYGGKRLRPYAEQPTLEPAADDDGEEDATIDLNFERPLEVWQPLPISAQSLDPEVLPQRFIDGCHSGQTIVWLRDADAHPIPVRLAEVGGVCLRSEGRSLHRERVRVERIVCLIADSFPPEEIEDFALGLQKHQIRLVRALPPKIGEVRQLTYDLACMEQRTYTQAQVEMRALEKWTLDQDAETLSLVDGPLGRLEHPRAIGVIKQHRTNYLGMHRQCWQVFYSLEPGQRTPAFRLSSQNLPVISWYLKLDGARGTMPNWGIVRVEISCAHFERQRCDFAYLDRLSNALMHLRCRQSSYTRAPVSMEPIVYAEKSLKSLLTPLATLAQRFYHLTGL